MADYVKDPTAVLDYQIDWTSWLASGETITTSTWTVTTGMTINSNSNTTATATVWLSGGTANTSYTATNHITTNQGRQNTRSIRLYVENL